MLTLSDGGGTEEERSIGRFRKALSIVVVNVDTKPEPTAVRAAITEQIRYPRACRTHAYATTGARDYINGEEMWQ